MINKFLNNIINFLHKRSNKQFSSAYKIFTLIWGIFLFIFFLPWLFHFLGTILENYLAIDWHPALEIIIFIIAFPLGLFFIFWTLIVQVKTGKGTPAPYAPTKILIITGPFKLCRNPMQLGLLFYYTGIGTLFHSLTTGLISILIYFLFSIPYHKFIEEKELELRFGKDYLKYKKTTPYIFPRFKLRQ